MEHVYEVSVNWQDGRRGMLSSPDLEPRIEVATPPQFDGGMPNVWSPEHLFVAAVNSCLMTTFLAIAGNSKLEIVSYTSKGSGKLELGEGKYAISEVILEPRVVVADEQQRARALRILEKAEANCLIGNSIRSKVLLRPLVDIRKSAA